MPYDATGGGYQEVASEAPVPSEPTGGTETRDQVERFLRLAQDRFRTVVEAEIVLRQQMLEDLRFRASEQWPDNVRSMREQDNRPCLTVNRIPSFIRQVTNNQRASRPSVQVSPVGDAADVDTAEVLQGIVRHIETKSDADVVYATAGDHQCTMGRGYVRVVTKYLDNSDAPVTMDQEIQLERISNPFSVYLDPTCQKFDSSDARYGFVVEDLPKEEYRSRYPQSQMADLSEFTSTGNMQPEWMPEGNVRIAEYFYVEETRRQMVFLSGPDGIQLTVERSKINTKTMPEGVEVIGEREVVTREVKWALINAVEILEGNEEYTSGRDWPGKYIPLVPVLGDEININGVRDYRGIVRDARDPQRMYNYWVSAETEMIALAPRAPFVAAEGQFEGHEAKWKTANVRNYPYLEYKPKSIAGQPSPPPQRQAWEPPIQAMTMAIAQSDNDLKATGGFHDASLGQRGPQESGRALRARQQQDEMSNSHYLDNLARSIRQVGRIFVDLIPKIYDTARVLRIIGIDEQERTVMVFSGEENQPPDGQPQQLPAGVQGVYDLGLGRYDVSVSVGPSFQSRRQEAVDSLVQFVQAYPNAFPLIGDLLAENMDWPGAKQVSERLKKMLPPQLQDQPNLQNLPPEVQQRLQQVEMQLQQVTQAYQQAQEAIQTDQVKRQAEITIKDRELAADAASQERDLQARLQLEQIKQESESARTLAKIEQDRASEILNTKITRLENLIARDVERSNQEEARFEKMAKPTPPPQSQPQQAPPRPPSPRRT